MQGHGEKAGLGTISPGFWSQFGCLLVEQQQGSYLPFQYLSFPICENENDVIDPPQTVALELN